MQVPAISSDAVLPLTVQTVGVVDAKLTANPELAVAMSESLVAAVCAAIAPNIIVCAFSTLNDSETEARRRIRPIARLRCGDRTRSATTESCSAAGKRAYRGRRSGVSHRQPRTAVAPRVSGVPITCVPTVPKLIVCVCLFTVKLWLTDPAAAYKSHFRLALPPRYKFPKQGTMPCYSPPCTPSESKMYK